jgi:hypothetical protein
VCKTDFDEPRGGVIGRRSGRRMRDQPIQRHHASRFPRGREIRGAALDRQLHALPQPPRPGNLQRSAMGSDSASHAAPREFDRTGGAKDNGVLAISELIRRKLKSGLRKRNRSGIAADSHVFLGAILAWLIHPAFISPSGFVGAGLVFAGVTATCGMGMILSRIPWNKGDAATESCSAS